MSVRNVVEEIRPYVPGTPIEEVKRQSGREDVIKLASNENPLGPSRRVVRAMRERLGQVNLYPDPSCSELKKTLSEKIGTREKQLIIGNGSVEVVQLIAETFLDPGDETITADPTFPKYKKATQIASGQCKLLPLKEGTYDLEAMADAITEKTKLVFIANPNNPTGTIVTSEEVSSFMERVSERVLVVFDEAYYEYIEREDYPKTLEYIQEGRKVIMLRTFSKVYALAGLRIGYGIGPEELISAMDKVRETFNVNSLAQAAAIASLEDQEHVERSKRINREGKEYLYQQLNGLGLPYIESVANFILINVPEQATAVYEKLVAQGIIVRPMHFYGLPNSIRVAVGTPEQNERFIHALQRVLP